jgi:hypothetical protein
LLVLLLELGEAPIAVLAGEPALLAITCPAGFLGLALRLGTNLVHVMQALAVDERERARDDRDVDREFAQRQGAGENAIAAAAIAMMVPRPSQAMMAQTCFSNSASSHSNITRPRPSARGAGLS